MLQNWCQKTLWNILFIHWNTLWKQKTCLLSDYIYSSPSDKTDWVLKRESLRLTVMSCNCSSHFVLQSLNNRRLWHYACELSGKLSISILNRVKGIHWCPEPTSTENEVQLAFPKRIDNMEIVFAFQCYSVLSSVCLIVQYSPVAKKMEPYWICYMRY